MKLRLDENLPHSFRQHLIGHEAFTVTFMGWNGTKNGLLLQRAADARFDAVLTMDDGMSHQQNAKTIPLAIVIITARSNDIIDSQTIVPALLQQLTDLPRRSIIHVPPSP